jgi:hypothetical protein
VTKFANQLLHEVTTKRITRSQQTETNIRPLSVMVISCKWSQPCKKWSKYKEQFTSNIRRFVGSYLSPVLVTEYGMIFYICNYVHVKKYAKGNSTSSKAVNQNLPAGNTMHTFHQYSLYLSWDLTNITDEWPVLLLCTWKSSVWISAQRSAILTYSQFPSVSWGKLWVGNLQ